MSDDVFHDAWVEILKNGVIVDRGVIISKSIAPHDQTTGFLVELATGINVTGKDAPTALTFKQELAPDGTTHEAIPMDNWKGTGFRARVVSQRKATQNTGRQ